MIDIIYAYPLLAGGVGFLIIILAYWIFRLSKKIDLTIVLLKSAKASDNAFSDILQQCNVRLKEIQEEQCRPKNTCTLKFKTLTPIADRFNMKIPILEITTFPDTTKSLVFWEGLVFIIENKLHVYPDNFNAVLNSFKEWQSKSPGE